MVTIASIIVIFLETILCKFFLDLFLGKPERRKSVYIFVMLAFVCAFLCAVFLSNAFAIKIMTVMVGNIIIWKLCYRSKWLKTAIIYVAYLALQLVSDYGVTIIMYNFFPRVISNATNNDIVGIVASLFSKTVVFIIILVIRQTINKKERNAAQDYGNIFIFPIVTAVLMVVLISNWYIIESRAQANVLMSISLVIIIMNLVVFIWVDGGMSEYGVRLEMASEKQRAAIHEFKNLLTVMYQLAEENDTDGLRTLINDSRKWLSKKVDRVATKNPILDIILNEKIEEMENLSIAHTVSLNVIARLPVSESDFVILISNVLNNAIEAAQECEEPFIDIKCSQSEHNFYFYVENTISNIPLYKDGAFISSKDDRDNHGKGIANVLEIVERYHGEYDIDIVGNTSGFSIMFYLDRK